MQELVRRSFFQLAPDELGFCELRQAVFDQRIKVPTDAPGSDHRDSAQELQRQFVGPSVGEYGVGIEQVIFLQPFELLEEDAAPAGGANLAGSTNHRPGSVRPGNQDAIRRTFTTTERPALQRRMEDVAAGKIDCVVVYKVDRLSRSLLDFARIMETFGKPLGVQYVPDVDSLLIGQALHLDSM